MVHPVPFPNNGEGYAPSGTESGATRCLDANEFTVVVPCSGRGPPHVSWWPSLLC